MLRCIASDIHLVTRIRPITSVRKWYSFSRIHLTLLRRRWFLLGNYYRGYATSLATLVYVAPRFTTLNCQAAFTPQTSDLATTSEMARIGEKLAIRLFPSNFPARGSSAGGGVLLGIDELKICSFLFILIVNVKLRYQVEFV